MKPLMNLERKVSNMNYLSVCSGVEAATVAWHDLGWKPVGYSEIEPFPSAVLAHHYPDVTNYGDMTKYKDWSLDGSVDLIVGGTPCQSFSVAGLRKGMDDPRGNLALVYCGMLDHFRPKWFVWENVPGVLSSSGGRDFGSFLGALAQLGYGFAYRVLDAQYFGVAQRRRRVFVVGYLGDWRPPAAVLFERNSLRRDTAPSRASGQEPTAFFESSLSQYKQADIGGTLKASGGVLGGGNETFLTQKVYESHGQDARYTELKSTCSTVSATYGMGGGNVPLVQTVYETHPADSRVKEMGDTCQTVTSRWGTGGGNVPLVESANVAHTFKVRGGCEGGGKGYLGQDEQAFTLSTLQDQHLFYDTKVRRLTPIECERLQGFPDGYTNVPWRKKDLSPDSLRYKALGNSMAVPVMQWIGERINNINKDLK
jgi:DNA (cytosine-5)-methyltransferase 1